MLLISKNDAIRMPGGNLALRNPLKKLLGPFKGRGEVERALRVGGELEITPLSVAGTDCGSRISIGSRPSERFWELFLTVSGRG